MRELKIGDRVKCISLKTEAIGKIGTVRGFVCTYPHILVEFDEYINGHDGLNKCDYKGRNGYCYYLDKEHLEFITSAPKFNIGDRVKVQGATGCTARYNGRVFTIKSVNPNGENAFSETYYSVGEIYVVKESELVPADNEQKIVITTDGKTTVAKLYNGDTVVKEAKADCSPEDKFDFTQGAKLAFERLTHTFKFEVGKMYAVGNSSVIIKITSAEHKSTDNRYKIEYVKGSECFNFFDEHSVFAENLKPYEPPKYYNGKVVCIKSHYSWWTVGKVYEVVDGIITANDGDKYPKRPLQPYADAEDVRHAGGCSPDGRHNAGNEFVPLVE